METSHNTQHDTLPGEAHGTQPTNLNTVRSIPLRTQCMEDSSDVATRGKTHNAKPPTTLEGDDSSTNLRAQTMKDSADAPARGEAYPSKPKPTVKAPLSSLTKNKKGTKNTNIQRPGAYRIPSVGVMEKKMHRRAKNSNDSVVDKRSVNIQRPGAYEATDAAVEPGDKSNDSSDVFRSEISDTGYTGYAPTARSRGDIVIPEVHRDTAEPDFPTASTEKKNKKKMSKPGPFTLVGQKAGATDNAPNGPTAHAPVLVESINEQELREGSELRGAPSGIASPDSTYSHTEDGSSSFRDGESLVRQPLASRNCVHGGEILPEASSVDEDAKWHGRTRMKSFLIFLIIVCVIGVAVGVAVSISSTSLSSGDLESTQPTSVPSAAPSSLASTIDLNPCLSIDASYEASDRFQTIRATLVDGKISDEALFDVPYSPQRHALCWVADVDQISMNEKRSTQRYILATMFYNLVKTGSKFASSNWVDRSKSECDWEGVKCILDEDNKGITEIKLESEDLEGELPKEIAGLKHLTKINLKGNRLSGTLPTVIGQMTNLERILFRANKFHGSIPSEYGNLINLDAFEVENNNLEGSPGHTVRKWTKLEFLFLGDNKFNGTILDDVTSLSSLVRLDVGNNDFSGTLPSELGDMSALRGIDVARNDMFGTLPTEYGQLTQLEALILDHNEFNSTLPIEYGSLTNLAFLHIDSTDITGDVLLDHPVCNLTTGDGSLETFYATRKSDFDCACCSFK